MINLILLASGYGKRFGENKLLFEIDGMPMYRHILDRLQNVSKKCICGHEVKLTVVTQYEEIISYCSKADIFSIYNGNADEGISASIKLGIMNANDCEWYFFFVADQPYLEEETIDGFITSVLTSDKKLASVCHGDIPGNPTAFKREFKQDLLELKADTGGRSVLKRHLNEILWYEISKKEIRDIDDKNETHL